MYPLMFLYSIFQFTVQELKQVASALASFFPPPIVGFLVICTALVVMLQYYKRRHASSLDIPGPFYFPFTGCMYLFNWSSSPHKTLAWLSRIYGNVYSIHLGGNNIIIVNSMETIREVLYQKSRDFAGRPQLFSFTLWEFDPMMYKDYSSEYLHEKYKVKISLQRLLNREECIISRTRKAIQFLNEGFEIKELEKDAFDPDKILRETVSDLIMDCLFGPSISRLFYHEARVVLALASKMYVKTAYVGACIDFISVMQYMSQKKISSTRFHVAQLREFVRRVYHVHQGSTLHHCDYTTSLAYILRSQNQGYRSCDHDNLSETTLNDDTIVAILCEVIFNAYEKISTCFSWCVARLAANPNLQRDIQQELSDDYLGNGSRPLLAATINEVLRTTCVLPFGIPRRTTKETSLNGYNIPQGTIVFLNLWSCCNDAKQFSSPHQFNPYRFISNESPEAKPSEVFPSCCCFSEGERKCLGDTLARRFLVSLTGGLLRKFDLELASSRSRKSLQGGVYGWTLRPKRYTINVRNRLPLNSINTDNNPVIDQHVLC